MTQRKRIVLNTVASYARSLLSAACGIFSTRWVLMALGQEDYGLFGLIGGLVIFVTFLNVQFSSSISRYYAYAVGQGKGVSEDNDFALRECQSWFTVALLIHTTLPVVLITVGYPIGSYLIGHGTVLNIPEPRIDACIWLWRFVCISAFIGMINVPFRAMYTAKQYIAELTIYSLFQTLFRIVIAYGMTLSQRDWLVPYGFIMMFAAILPQVLICVRAIYVFPECRVRWSAVRDTWRMWRLGCFAFWSGVGGLGYLASHQCMSVIINRNFGAKVTGAFNVSQTVATEAGVLTGALQSAFQPAITTAFGAGAIATVKQMAFEVCKFGTLLTLAFALPMSIEIKALLNCWLKEPPAYAAEMCVCILSFIAIEKLSYGHLVAVNAGGKIAAFQSLRGVLRATVIPIALILICIYKTASMAALALPVSGAIVVVGDVIVARRMVGLSARLWLKEIVFPFFVIIGFCIGIGMSSRLFMPESFLRIVVTTIINITTLLFLSWVVLFNTNEKQVVVNCVRRIITRLAEYK